MKMDLNCMQNSLFILVCWLALFTEVTFGGLQCPPVLSNVKRGFQAIHDKTCYLFVNHEVFWKTARDDCWKLGGEMLVIKNKESMDFIRKTLNSEELGWRREGVWIGAKYERRRWSWTDGTRVGYTNWASGQPSKVLGFLSLEDCAQMREDDNWKWHDSVCGSLDFHYNYICQFSMADAPHNDVTKEQATNRIASGTTNQQEDNGNMKYIVIVVAITCTFLILVIIILVLVKRYNRIVKAKAAERAVHFVNDRHHHNSEPHANGGGARNGSVSANHEPIGMMPVAAPRPPPIPATRPPPVNNLYLSPKEINGVYTEVIPPNGNCPIHHPTSSTTNHTHGSYPSVTSNSHYGSESELLGACGRSNDSADMARPLLTTSPETSHTQPPSSFSSCSSNTNSNSVPTEGCTCCVGGESQQHHSEYVDMNSLVSRESCEKLDSNPNKSLSSMEEEDKHTYSNLHLDSHQNTNINMAVENLYEPLP